MLKKTIEFTDYNGNKVIKDYYFDLSQTELYLYEAKFPGGVAAKIKSVIDSHNVPEIVSIFDELINMAYGEKSPDGLEFVKSEEITRHFRQSPAFDIFFMELVSKEGAASDFINGIIPQNMLDEAKTPEVEVVKS